MTATGSFYRLVRVQEPAEEDKLSLYKEADGRFWRIELLNDHHQGNVDKFDHTVGAKKST
jgi:hypothetical protein